MNGLTNIGDFLGDIIDLVIVGGLSILLLLLVYALAEFCGRIFKRNVVKYCILGTVGTLIGTLALIRIVKSLISLFTFPV